jgi:hypothetical protein
MVTRPLILFVLKYQATMQARSYGEGGQRCGGGGNVITQSPPLKACSARLSV